MVEIVPIRKSLYCFNYDAKPKYIYQINQNNHNRVFNPKLNPTQNPTYVTFTMEDRRIILA